MEQVLAKVTEVLGHEFPGVKLELEATWSGKVGGTVIWEGFVGHDQVDRQQKLWGVLKQNLDTQTERKIATLLTLTPWEVQEMDEVEMDEPIAA